MRAGCTRFSQTAINRMNSDEKKALNASCEEIWADYRRAAEAHRQTRKWAKSWIRPGMKMFDIVLVLHII